MELPIATVEAYQRLNWEKFRRKISVQQAQNEAQALFRLARFGQQKNPPKK